MDGTDDSQSYFAAARPKNGLDDTLEELKLLQRNLVASRSNQGSPSRGPLLNTPSPIIPTTGAAPYLYVDPSATQQAHEQLRNQMLLKQFQLLPPNTPKILMNTKKLPRFAGERQDLLKETEETFYGGGHAPRPSPTPTPPQQPHYFPVSYFT